MQMRISADNDYLNDSPNIQIGAIVNVRRCGGKYPANPLLIYEFEDPDEPGNWLCCEARELDPLVPEKDLEAQIEALTEKYQRLLDVKDAALGIAAFAFSHYAEQHFNKGTPESTMKALTNLGLERTMLDAQEAD